LGLRTLGEFEGPFSSRTRNSAISSLQAHGLGYDRVIVLGLLNNPVSAVAYGTFAEPSVYVSANLLAALENVKVGLDDLIADASRRFEQIANLAVSCSAASYENGLLKLESKASILTFPLGCGSRLRMPSRQQAAADDVESGPFTLASGLFGGIGFQPVESGYPGYVSDDNLIDCRLSPELACALQAPGCFMAFLSADAVILNRLIFLPCFLLLRVISEYEEWRSLVVRATATLLLRLRSVPVPHAIATCQRNFFTHHGTHPPANSLQRQLGSFSGRVFHLQYAV
jgi:hypothetical protein